MTMREALVRFLLSGGYEEGYYHPGIGVFIPKSVVDLVVDVNDAVKIVLPPTVQLTDGSGTEQAT